MMIQMMYLDMNPTNDILWSNETEVAIVDGDVLIPRVVPDHEANRNFNSARRQITMDFSPTASPIEVAVCHSSNGLRLGPSTRVGPKVQKAPARVLGSSLFRFACLDSKSQPFHIFIGYTEDKSQRILGFSETNASIVTTILDYSFTWETNTNSDTLLYIILTLILSKSLVSNSEGTI
jgi:hypothetical protein